MNEEFFLKRQQMGEVIRVQLNQEAKESVGGNPGRKGWLIGAGRDPHIARVKWDGEVAPSNIHIGFLQEDVLHELASPAKVHVS